MKLKTTAILAVCGVLASTAGAFAIPTGPSPALGPDPEAAQVASSLGGAGGKSGWGNPGSGAPGARITTGDTLLVDARLGHATLPKSGSGETFLFAQLAAADGSSSAGSGASSGTVAAPLNLAIVIDRSGSMKGDRIANAMNAAVAALERMREGDSVTVVSFDTSAQVVVPPTRVSQGTRPSIEAAIRSIRLGGDTCISCGLEEAMQQLALTTLSGDRIHRMILLSDGATNNGIRDMGGLRGMASRMHARGVTISTIGVDVDFDEKVMAAIASEANGRHYFVANASGLSSVFAQEFDDLLASVAKEAELAIQLAPGVELAEVFDRTFRREGNTIFVPFGTFSAKQEKTVLVKLRVPTDREGDAPVADVKLSFRDLVKKSDGSCAGSLAVAIKGDGTEQRDMDPFVAARLERSRTAQTLTEANKLFEAGRISDARAKLAERKAALEKTEGRAVALAAASPSAAPRNAKKAIDRDFEDQLGAVARADSSFAPAPADDASSSRGAGGFAPAPPLAAPATRGGKAQVRANQEAASVFAH